MGSGFACYFSKKTSDQLQTFAKLRWGWKGGGDLSQKNVQNKIRPYHRRARFPSLLLLMPRSLLTGKLSDHI